MREWHTNTNENFSAHIILYSVEHIITWYIFVHSSRSSSLNILFFCYSTTIVFHPFVLSSAPFPPAMTARMDILRHFIAVIQNSSSVCTHIDSATVQNGGKKNISMIDIILSDIPLLRALFLFFTIRLFSFIFPFSFFIRTQSTGSRSHDWPFVYASNSVWRG